MAKGKMKFDTTLPSTISIISPTPTSRAEEKISAFPDSEIVTFPEGSGVKLHSAFFPGWIKDKKDVDFSEFMKRWSVLKDQIGTMIGDMTQQTFGKMALDKVEVSIAVSGEGSIGIATAKGEASIVLTFQKAGAKS